MKGKLLKKLCAVSLSLLMLFGGGAAAVSVVNNTAVSVQAGGGANIEKCGDYVYELMPEGAVIIGYDGNEKNVVIPQTLNGELVVGIENIAFYRAHNVTSITLPSTLKHLRSGSLDGTAWYRNQPNGDVYIGNWYYGYKGDMPENYKLTIKNGPEMIASYAFLNQENLVELSIPNSVKTLDRNSLACCPNLKKITLSNSITSIGCGAFSSCTSLESLTLPKNIKILEDQVFDSCRKLKKVTLPQGLESIGYDAFQDCTSLTSITIPDSVTEIESYAFSGCTSLRTINFPKSHVLLWDNVFENTAWLDNQPDGAVYLGSTLYKFKGTVPKNTTWKVKAGTTAIAPCAFEGQENLSLISLPDGLISIGAQCFMGCSNLRTVSIPETVTYLGSEVFNGCSSLTSVNIPPLLKSISESLFFECSSLASITIPESITSIHGNAFYRCSSLKDVKLPSGLKSLDSCAFGNCSSLRSITIPSGIKTIPFGLLFGCKNLKSVSLPNGLETIEQCAFWYCPVLSSVTLPGTLTEIQNDAFKDCSALTSITIPKKVTSLSSSAFPGCDHLKSISVQQDNPTYTSVNGIVYSKDKKTLVLCPNGKTGSVTILSGVTTIGDSAFCNCTGLTSIILPTSLTSIKSDAFSYCTSLKKLTIPNGVKEFGSCNGCTNLESVTIPDSVTWMEYGTFADCTNLKSVVLSKNVSSIPSSCFFGCTSLTSVKLPNKLTEINNYAFSGCSALKSITIPSTVTRIGSGAFYECSGLTSITIPGGISHLDYETFGDCYNLKKITIPSSVTEIEDYALPYSDSLTIYGKRGSYAESFAADHDYPFKAVTMYASNISKLSADRIVLGQSVTVNCAAEGSSSPFTFAVYYKQELQKTWTRVQNYSSKKTVTITPKRSDCFYYIRVSAKNADGVVCTKEFGLYVCSKLQNLSSISSDVISKGETVTIYPDYTGGMGYSAQFAVFYKQRSQTSWTCAQNYTESDSVVLTPKAATVYTIRVKARDEGGNISNKDFTLTVTAPLVNRSTISAQNIRKGRSVTVTANASGGQGNYQYAVFYKQKSQTSWTCAQNYQTNKKVTITPKTATNYVIRVKIKDNSGKVVNKDFNVTVTP